MARLFYISHPNVTIDPDVLVPQWGLSPLGRDRATAMLSQPWISTVGHIVSSSEAKALETADILARHLGLDFETVEASGEIDRSATGYVAQERHDDLRDRLFHQPTVSADGWERAVDAQRRIASALQPAIDRVISGTTVAVVGHGGVGTMFMCRLMDTEISLSLDQPGQGHYWSWDATIPKVLHEWRPIDIAIEPTSPRADDVVELLTTHLDFARQTSPREHVHALDIDGLDVDDVAFFAARRSGELLAVGALRDLGNQRAEIKSMHTASAARGQGLGRLMLDHLVDVATTNKHRWIGLETGTMDAFAPARTLYASAGFVECEPFGNYTVNEFSVCMSRTV